MSLHHASIENAGNASQSFWRRSTLGRTRLDWAIIISLLAMGSFNLIATADRIGPAKAYAAPVCGVPLA
ncbi:hypothetical protein I5E68_03265 [Novosphingobium sp. YJ-S2-02]|uniref:Uncharacterized protein n=1 Tax=Novosphingobium aureum TaxID=2792964 RepID=A0A931H9Q9_9SPHN|nr:hypothetical protein [Novosphingobium aureum]MBH0111972.1 hypothetical protein [Novosphingobium aureum]